MSWCIIHSIVVFLFRPNFSGEAEDFCLEVPRRRMVERAWLWPDQRGRWLSSKLHVESVCNNWKIYIDMMDILHRLTFSLANWRRKEKYFWLDREDSNANIQVRFIWYPVKGRKCILWHSSFFAVRNISIVTLSLVEWRKNLLWNPSRYQQSQKFFYLKSR